MKTVLITGATSGIGRSTAELFLENGWKVIATGRRQERLAKLQEVFDTERLHTLCFDVQDSAATLSLLEKVPAEFSKIDVLVNNAGLGLGTLPAHQVALADWTTMIDTNITALVSLTHHLLPTLIEQQGLIVNLSSVAGTYPYLGGNVYGATKAFVRQFSLGLRSDLRGTAVRVTSLEPGMVETEFTGIRMRNPEAAAERFSNVKALTARDMARTILWVAEQPPHVNINAIEMMPTQQSFAGFHVEQN
jgi:serine 3-dehydrogenase